MRNHEVTVSHKVLDKNGQLTEPGWSRKLVQTYDKQDVKAPKFRLKEWDYYLVMSGNHAVALTISEMGYMGMLSASIINLEEKWEHTESILTAFPMGKWNMPSHSGSGVSAYSDERIQIKFDVEKGKRHLTCNFKKFNGDKDFVCDILLYEEEMESMVIATPFEKKRHFFYNQKILCLKAEGWAEYDGRRYEFRPETDTAVLDWGRGVWTYDNTWYWGAGNGYVDGKPFGFNIGYGFGDTSAATENVIVYDGKVHKLDDVTFHIPEDDYLKPWWFSSSDGRFETTFEPIIDRASETDVKIIVSKQHQVFGKMTGTLILDDGTELKIKDLLCFAEKVRNKY